MSWKEESIAYLRKHREHVARDLELLRSGHIKITEGSSDANADWIGRYQRQIAHLDQIIGNYEPPTEAA
jgi:hypothetical protein